MPDDSRHAFSKAKDCNIGSKPPSEEIFATQIWNEMRSEVLSQKWGNPSSKNADMNFPDLNLKALGLQTVSSESFFLFSGSAAVLLQSSKLPYSCPDGSHFVRVGNCSGGSVEIHYGVHQDQRYTMNSCGNGGDFGEFYASEADGKNYSDYHYRLANGDMETVYHSRNGQDEAVRKLRFSRSSDGSISYSSVSPKRPSDNFTLFKQASERHASAIILSPSGESTLKVHYSDNELIKCSRDKLLSALEKDHTDGWTWAKLQVNMMRLETTRLSQLEEIAVRNGQTGYNVKQVAARELTNTYTEALRLLQTEGKLKDKNSDTSLPWNRLAAACVEQIIDHASNPTEITQGIHPTCTAACLESRTYTRHPSKAAQLVVDLAISGTYSSAKSGLKIHLDPKSLQAHGDSQSYVPSDGMRGIASQLFELGALNLMYAKFKPELSYAQNEASDGASGDELSKGSKVIDDSPQSNHEWIMETASEIAGKKEPEWILRAEDLGKKFRHSVLINNEKDLENALRLAAAAGNYPLAIHVFTDHEPLYTESGERKLHKSGGAHIMCISGYQAGPPIKVEIDNQWGSKNDHLGNRALSLEETLTMMKNPFLTRILHKL